MLFGMLKLRFSRGNAKLAGDTAIFSLPAGHSCPAALLCFSKADKVSGKITDGKQCQFRCYAASAENLFRNVRTSRWFNFELLRACKSKSEMALLIMRSLPRKGIKLVRIHSSGDFFSQTYFDAWLDVAQQNPFVIFYAYTKALPFWVARLRGIPSNFKLVASRGGRYDNLIDEHGLRNALVVFSEAEARKARLPIDHDDTHAWKHTGNFALLLHGTQPAGSLASKQLYTLREQGKGGYRTDYFAHYKNKGA